MHVRFLALGALLFVPLAMKADTTYTYTGSNFNFSSVNGQPQNPPGTVAAPYSTSDFVSATFTVSGNVDNLSNQTFYFAPGTGSYSFNDGVQTITQANGDLFAQISTDGSGDITSYSIGAQNATIASDFINIGSMGSPASTGKFEVSPTEIVTALTNTEGSFGAPVTTAATPEPGSLVLLGTGLVGVMAEMRRRIRCS